MLNWMTLAAASAALGHTALESPKVQDKPTTPPAQTKAEDDPYQKAIKDMDAKSGLFRVFRKDETLLLEIPKELLGRELLWWIELKEAPNGSYSGTAVSGRVVKFEMRGEKLLMKDVDSNTVAKGGDDIARAVKKSNVEPIIAVFDLKAKNKDGSPLIDAGRLFRSELPELPIGSAVGGMGADPSRTFLEKANVFPDNLNVEVTMTFRGRGQAGDAYSLKSIGGTPSLTAVVHHSIIALPSKPMKPRLSDSRVGYFSTDFTQYDNTKHGVDTYAFINRYRLEKKDPNAELSEPVKPIVYYIGREVPKKWHKWMKLAVEDWNVAFEAAGFKNAIVCKEAPDDPNWSEEDIRYSVIRWAPLPIANAMGPSVVDPRTGEIISAHIIMWHDVLDLGAQWYFAQASPNDPSAQKLPLPEETMGEVMRFIVAHEVGHTLGLPHNGKGSAMVPIKLLRDPKWTKENGTATSIMDYARFNYVAQPGDGAGLMAKIGPYDKFSISWGYKPIPTASTPEDEKPILDGWASKMVGNPMLRFYDNFSPTDPNAQAESLGDDNMEASRLGMLNLKRVMGYLIPATTKIGEDYTTLNSTYGSVLGQYTRYISHVTANVGGVIQTDYHAGRGGQVYKHQTKAMQKKAVQWVSDWVLEPQLWLFPSDVLLRVGPVGPTQRVAATQTMALNGLLSTSRIGRMLENEELNGDAAYTVKEMMQDLRTSVWKELSMPKPVINLYRRQTQRIFVNTLISRLPGVSTEARAIALAELKSQAFLIGTAVNRAGDAATRAHLEELQQNIKLSLENPTAPPAAPSGGGFLPFINISDEDMMDYDGCGICKAKHTLTELVNKKLKK